MNKFLKYIPILFILLWSCDPMEETYNELDKESNPYNEKIEYLLSSGDYAIASSAALINAVDKADSILAEDIKKDLAFNSNFTANDYMHSVLSSNFMALKEGSSALVTYNTTTKPEALLVYEMAEEYTLSDEDYKSIGDYVAINHSFSPSAKPEIHIPGILKTKYPDATTDKLVLTTYKNAEIDGILAQVYFETDFSEYSDKDSIGENDEWQQYTEKGTRGWQAREYSSNSYAQYSSYSSGEENIAYLISPAIELTGANHEFSFDINIGYWTHAGLSILISSDFDGTDVESASWDDVTSGFSIPELPTDTYGSFTSAGKLDISSYSGTIYIAFKYVGDGENSQTTTYQIDNIKVKEKGIEPDEYDIFYQFTDSEWSIPENVYVLNSLDYEEMGAPGSNHSFSSSNSPDHYLPIFLSKKHPYASNGDTYMIAYAYHNGVNTSKKANEYVYNTGIWTSTSSANTVTRSDQFVRNKTKWVFDPTVKFTMISDDYQMITDYVQNNNPEYVYTGSDGKTREYYYGSASKYSNFDMRLVKRDEFEIPGFDGISEDEGIELMWERIGEGVELLLSLKFPNAVTQVSGVNVFYEVTFATYENDLSRNKYMIKVQCTKDGPEPEFMLVEEAIIVD